MRFARPRLLFAAVVVSLVPVSVAVIPAPAGALSVAHKATACASYRYERGRSRIEVGSIKAKSVSCKGADSVIRGFDAKHGHYEVGARIKIQDWTCDVFRPVDLPSGLTQVLGLCTRPGGGNLSWAETSKA